MEESENRGLKLKYFRRTKARIEDKGISSCTAADLLPGAAFTTELWSWTELWNRAEVEIKEPVPLFADLFVIILQTNLPNLRLVMV